LRRLFPWLPAAAWACLLLLLGSLPGDRLPRGGFLDLPHVDKAAHVGLYAVLGLLAAGPVRAARAAPLLLAGVSACALVGGADEARQGAVPGRRPSRADLAADLLGGALGATLLAGLRTARRRARS